MDGYSRLVAILKIGLPLLALVMLASMFLVTTEEDFEGGIAFTEADLDQLGQGLQITEPVMTGSTASQDPFRFTAKVVKPDAAPPTRAEIETLEGRIDFLGGPAVEVAAPEAALDLESETLAMSGRVTIETDDGYTLTADRMEVGLRGGAAQAEGRVEGFGPMGTITSETLRIVPAQGDGDRRVFSFGNGVHLVYRGDDASEP
jgi:lipopolysaccharide export system protein LptC